MRAWGAAEVMRMPCRHNRMRDASWAATPTAALCHTRMMNRRTGAGPSVSVVLRGGFLSLMSHSSVTDPRLCIKELFARLAETLP